MHGGALWTSSCSEWQNQPHSISAQSFIAAPLSAALMDCRSNERDTCLVTTVNPQNTSTKRCYQPCLMHFLATEPESWHRRRTQTVASKLHCPEEPGLLGEMAIPGHPSLMRLAYRNIPGCKEAVKDHESQVKRLRGQRVEPPTGQRWNNLSSNKNAVIRESCDT